MNKSISISRKNSASVDTKSTEAFPISNGYDIVLDDESAIDASAHNCHAAFCTCADVNRNRSLGFH